MKKSVSKRKSPQKKVDCCKQEIVDKTLIGLGVFFFVWFLVSFFPSTSLREWKWALLIISIILLIKPIMNKIKK